MAEKKGIDWDRLKAEYITDDTSYRQLAEKYDLRMQTVAERSKKEGWRAEKKKHKEKVVKRAVRKIEKKKADRLVRIQMAGDRLLEKIEKAIDELDLQICTNVKKTKVIEYNNADRPDKPTKETIEETNVVVEHKTIIDRKGLQAIANALNSLRDVQMLRTELDNEEQILRIERMKKEASQADTSQSIKVSFEGVKDEWLK